MISAWGALVGLLIVTSLPEQDQQTAKFAVVIGNNIALPGSGYQALNYADDDALRFTDFFRSLGIDTTVLTAADAESAARYPELSEHARRPTQAQLMRTLRELEDKLRAAEGKPRELYFVYSGHGSVSSTGAYLHLFDGPFSRIDLFEQVLRRLPAERVHVIIDSCHSYFLANSRGERVSVAADEDSLDRYPWVGFFLSTSAKREVQEWSGYQAGVFSHQMLGALRGAADVNADGIVSYTEAHAYVAAANLAVENPQARIQAHIRRPNVGPANLVDLRQVPLQYKAKLLSDFAGRFHIQSKVFGRVLDAHKASGKELYLVLPKTGSLVVYHADKTLLVRSSTSGYALLTAPSVGDSSSISLSKGNLVDELRTKLFSIPLSPAFISGVAAASPQVTRTYVRMAVAGPWQEDAVTLGLLAGGTGALLLSSAAALVWIDAQHTANQRPVTILSEEARGRAQGWQIALTASSVLSASHLVGGILRATLVNQSQSIGGQFTFAPLVSDEGLGFAIGSAF